MEGKPGRMETKVKFPVHANLALGVITCLQKIFRENLYADAVLYDVFRNNKKWGARDRKYVAETVYEAVRWWRLLWESYGRQEALDHEGLTGFLHYYHENAISDLRKRAKTPAIRESIPDWLHELGQSEMGAAWEKEIHALNEEAPVILRTNTLKINRPELLKELAGEGVEAVQYEHSRHDFPEAIILTKRVNVFLTRSFRNGLFEVQDSASQAVAPFMDVQPGMRVIDACAGGGGKSLHLVALMKNKGRIIALDVSAAKLYELTKRAKRAGAHIIEPRLIETTKVIKRLAGSADRVLLDVPCSGLGVLRRNPDAKWKISPEMIERVKKQQQEILEKYSSMVNPGGKLIYSTCSILPSENERQVECFINKNKSPLATPLPSRVRRDRPEGGELKSPSGGPACRQAGLGVNSDNNSFKLIRQQSFSPADDGVDGFYMASLQRK